MAEVYFYHLTRSPIEQVLPDLLDKCLGKKWRVCVRGTDRDRLDWLDGRIWLYRDDWFLPHGLAGGPNDRHQPVLLTTGEASNLADVLMLVDGARPDVAELGDYERVMLVFDGHNDTAVANAREDWKAVTTAQVPAQYWAQEDRGWVKKA